MFFNTIINIVNGLMIFIFFIFFIFILYTSTLSFSIYELINKNVYNSIYFKTDEYLDSQEKLKPCIIAESNSNIYKINCLFKFDSLNNSVKLELNNSEIMFDLDLDLDKLILPFYINSEDKK